MLGHSMFGMFEVRYFGVRSKTNYTILGTYVLVLQSCKRLKKIENILIKISLNTYKK